MCDNAVNNYACATGFFPHCYKTKQLRDKVFSTYPSAVIFVPDQFKAQEMCDNAVYVCDFAFNFVLD